jgi:hypothetical protein
MLVPFETVEKLLFAEQAAAQGNKYLWSSSNAGRDISGLLNRHLNFLRLYPKLTKLYKAFRAAGPYFVSQLAC